MDNENYILTLIENEEHDEALYQIELLWDSHELRVEDMWAFHGLMPESHRASIALFLE